MKDFYDLWLMSRQFKFDGEKLCQAIKKTFQYRETTLPQSAPLFSESIYDEKSNQSAMWKTFMRKSGIKISAGNLADVAQRIENLLTEPVESITQSKKIRRHWHPDGFWK